MPSVREEIRERVKKNAEESLASTETSFVLWQAREAFMEMWNYLECNKGDKAPAPYDMIDNLFGSINRAKIEEVFDYAVQKSGKGGISPKRGKVVGKAEVQKRISGH